MHHRFPIKDFGNDGVNEIQSVNRAMKDAEKNNTTAKVQATRKSIIKGAVEYAQKSLREIAQAISGTKSSVHRSEKARKERDQHPESYLWETEAGNEWTRLLFFATIYHFGFECGVGADKLSDYFKLIRIDTHIGSSPSTVLRQLQTMEGLLPEFQTLCENQFESTTRESVVAMDETFFGDFLILVLMDLRSGYLILESVATDRCFDTWFTHVEPRLKRLGIHVRHAVTDRAKALIKLAITGFECESGADLFHAQQDVVRWLGASLGRRLSNAEKQQAVATESEDSAQKEQNVASIKESKLQYHENLQGLSEDLHPFTLLNNQPQTEDRLLDKLEKRVRCFEEIAQKQAIPDNNNTAKKLRNQMKPLALNVTAWWLWVNENLQALKVDAILQTWIIETLLPVVYWHHQRHKTQNTLLREKYQQAWESSSEVLRHHPLTHALPDCKLQHWLAWAEWMVQHFHRSSSAVEGRNGCLSKMYHNGRGISESRLKALTVIHNYGLKRQDGTTAAQRFFEQGFPDLFSWVLDQMGELPLPRKGRPKVVLDPLKLLAVPA